MARLIDADKIIYCNYDLDNYHSFLAVTDDDIAEMPTVELVHCQDCKHLFNRIGFYHCTHRRGLREISEGSYCGYGERKEDG